jgi:hypothetical protein
MGIPYKKVLTLGHSLALDACHMLAAVVAAEGEQLEIATLYDSGCPLFRHVEYLQSGSRKYSLHVSSTETPGLPPKVMKEVTMEEAILYSDFDLIMMQGGTFEIARSETYTNGNIQIIQDYVNQKKRNPDAVFAWHMPWAFATDPELMAKYPLSPNAYINGYKPYDTNRVRLHEAFCKCVTAHILPDDTFRFLIPTGTAMENAMSSSLEEKDLLHDYAHASDLGRLLAAYTWYCVLAGVKELPEMKMTTIPAALRRGGVAAGDRKLTEREQKILLEALNNALKNPLSLTNSQYV